MRALLWKEYCQNRQLFAAALVLLFLPYAVVAAIALVAIARYGALEQGAWPHNLTVASFIGMVIATIYSAFVAGNAVAGERVDCSAEFAAYLPLSRRSHIVAKLITAGATCVTMLLVHHIMYLMTASDAESPLLPPAAMWLSAMLIFGVAWGVSTFVGRPATAAVSGLGVVIILFFALNVVEELLHADADSAGRWYAWSCLVIGVGCFAGGVLYYLRRVEP